MTTQTSRVILGSINTKTFTWIILILMSLYAATSVARMVTNTLAAGGNIDFHSYWYDGVLLRYGINTFERQINNTAPPTVSYIGGIQDNVPTTLTLNTAPANPALGILFFGLIGNFHWVTAKMLWLIINLISAGSVPFLIIRLLPSPSQLTLETKLLIVVSFLILLPVRNAIGNGQLTVFTLCMMLLSIVIVRRFPWLAGVTLAAALIKFSVGTPLVLFFLYNRQWKPILLACVLHFIGIFAYSLATNTSVDVLFMQHINILLLWRIGIGDQGIALTSLLPNLALFTWGTLLIMSAITCLVLLRWYRLMTKSEIESHFVLPYIFTLFTLYITLAIYHSYYDSVIVGMFLALLIYVLSNASDPLHLSQQARFSLSLVLTIGLMVFSVPGSILGAFFDNDVMGLWLRIVQLSATIFLVVAYVLTIWIINRILTRPLDRVLQL